MACPLRIVISLKSGNRRMAERLIAIVVAGIGNRNRCFYHFAQLDKKILLSLEISKIIHSLLFILIVNALPQVRIAGLSNVGDWRYRKYPRCLVEHPVPNLFHHSPQGEGLREDFAPCQRTHQVSDEYFSLV